MESVFNDDLGLFTFKDSIPELVFNSILQTIKNKEVKYLLLDLLNVQTLCEKNQKALLDFQKQLNSKEITLILVLKENEFKQAYDFSSLNIIPTLVEAHDFINMDRLINSIS